MHLLVHALGLLSLASPQLPVLPVLHEESFLASDRPDSFVFGASLELEDDRLVLTGFGGLSEELLVLRKEGAAWIREHDAYNSSGVFEGFAVTALEKDRFLVSSAENNHTVLYRREAGAWTVEQDFWPRAGFSALHGNRLVTTSQYGYPGLPTPLKVWKREASGWVLEAEILPDAPQDYSTCCFPLDLFGDTLVFGARSSTGSLALQVYVRERGAWRKQAELAPAGGAEWINDLALWGSRIAVALQEPGSPLSTTFVYEREQGAWREVARLLPEASAGLALEGDTLVVGTTEAGPTGGAIVFERDRGTWGATHALVASDGWILGAEIALEGRTVVVSSHYDAPRAGRSYFFRLPPFARANAYGCGVNPAGSLEVLAGRPALGTELVLGLGNPRRTQAAGSLGYLVSARRADLDHPCGTLLPHLGMDGGPGEWLLRREPGAIVDVRVVGALEAPGTPLRHALAIPPLPALIGHHFFVQGALHDATPGAAVRWGVSTALELTIGL